ncbi:MAG: RecX family transcriptional regulator [Sphingomicrobium sp.]
MSTRKPPRDRPPLTTEKLNELALRYVGRFATTRARLRTYLARKVRERGWDGAAGPDLNALVERFAARGYVDDAGYALSKSRSLTARGYGKARVVQSLRVAGVEENDAVEARNLADREAVAAALRLAARKRIGPYAAEPGDPKMRERSLAAMVRGGHSFALARAIVVLAPGEDFDIEGLAEVAGCSADN